jgi:hypothetical protein
MFFFACNNAETKKTDEKCCDNEMCKDMCKDMITVDSLLANIDSFVGKEVKVCGQCIHVCQHSGKNIFVANPENDSILIIGKANDELGTFATELENKHVILYGVLKSVEVENSDPEVHHDITLEYFVEVSKVEKCECNKDGKCCGEKKNSGCCGDKKDHNCGGNHKEGCCKGKTTE